MIYIAFVATLLAVACFTRSALNKDKVGVASFGAAAIFGSYVIATHLVA